jgi:hypothetical protein
MQGGLTASLVRHVTPPPPLPLRSRVATRKLLHGNDLDGVRRPNSSIERA